jgi:uncharacterized damage-inducible protein DinB
MEWADSLCWNAVFSSPVAMTDSVLHLRLQHIHVVQHAFLHVWRNVHFDYESFTFSEPTELAHWGRNYHREAESYLKELDDAILDRPVVLPWAQAMVQKQFGRDAAAPTLGETLLQVVMHSTYHRGQVSTRLRELGAEPPLTDFIAWIWLGRPQPAWPESIL